MRSLSRQGVWVWVIIFCIWLKSPYIVAETRAQKLSADKIIADCMFGTKDSYALYVSMLDKTSRSKIDPTYFDRSVSDLKYGANEASCLRVKSEADQIVLKIRELISGNVQ